MLTTTQQFINKLEQEKVQYDYKDTQDSGVDVIIIHVQGSNNPNITLQFFFLANCTEVSIRIFDLVKIPQNKIEEMLRVANNLNTTYRYVKFVVDMEDDSLQMAMDTNLRNSDIGEVCILSYYRCTQVCDKAYPDIMKALWS